MTRPRQPSDTFRRTLGRAVVAPAIVPAVLAAVFLTQTGYLLSTARRVDRSDQVIGRANALLKLLVDGETGMRGYVITGEPDFLEPYHTEEADSGPAFERLSALVSGDQAQADRLDAVRRIHAEWRALARRVIDLRHSGGDYLAPIRNREGKRRMDAMRGHIADLIKAEEQDREARVRAAGAATWQVAAASLTLAVLFGGSLAALTRRQLTAVATSYGRALSATEAQAEALQRSAHRLETLHQIDRAILAADATPDLVRAALQRASQTVPSGASFVLALDPGGGPPRVFSRGDPGAPPPPGDWDPAEGPRDTDDLDRAVGRSPLEDRLRRAGMRSCLTSALRAGEQDYGVLVFVAPRPAAYSADHRLVAHEIAGQLSVALHQAWLRDQTRRHAEELERRVDERTRELQESLRNVRQLQGMLPICAWCKKVRDDQNYWHQVESYVAARTAARFTHGICPECYRAQEDEFRQPPTG